MWGPAVKLNENNIFFRSTDVFSSHNVDKKVNFTKQLLGSFLFTELFFNGFDLTLIKGIL